MAVAALFFGIGIAARPMVAWAIPHFTKTKEEQPPNLTFAEINVETTVTALTTLAKVRQVLVNNKTDQVLCLEVAADQTDCTSVTMTCTDSNSRDDDVYPLEAGETITLTMPRDSALCAKQAGATGNSEDVYVIERN